MSPVLVFCPYLYGTVVGWRLVGSEPDYGMLRIDLVMLDVMRGGPSVGVGV